MKKSVIVSLGVIIFAVISVCGCQLLSFGPSDEELIGITMDNWKAALIDQDLDKLMETYSEDYESMSGDDKEATRDFMEMVFDEGWVDDVEVGLEGAKTTIEENEAKFFPVELMLESGPITIDFTLQKEEGGWFIVGSESDR